MTMPSGQKARRFSEAEFEKVFDAVEEDNCMGGMSVACWKRGRRTLSMSRLHHAISAPCSAQ